MSSYRKIAGAANRLRPAFPQGGDRSSSIPRIRLNLKQDSKSRAFEENGEKLFQKISLDN
jgi:hypothetical protein